MTTELLDVIRTAGRNRFYHYMFTTAMEGGIGYWSYADEYHWGTDGGVKVVEDFDDFYAIISSNSDDEDWGVSHAYVSEIGAVTDITATQSLRIDRDVIERGWNLFVDKVIAATKSENPDAPFSRKYFRQAVVQWLTDCEEGDSDADVADMVVQLGLFGEVVYA